METFQLTQKQVKQLSDIAEHFSEINVFTLEQTHESGIGPTVVVKFDLFNNNPKSKDTTVDITDVESW
jgi:hypothetical protein